MLSVSLEQRRFFSYFNQSVQEIEASLGVRRYRSDEEKGRSSFLWKSGFEGHRVRDLEEECPVLDLYVPALVDNILFLAGQGDTHKAEFIRKAKEAWLHYWNEGSRGKRFGGRRWQSV